MAAFVCPNPVSAEAQGARESVPLATLVPELEIGREPGVHTAFVRVADLTADASGRIYVADAGDPRILVFDAFGRHERFVGRRGSGPGEFQAVARLGWRGDTLWALDPVARRISYFAQSGEHVRSALLAPLETALGFPLEVLGVFADGSLAAWPAASSSWVARASAQAPLLRVAKPGTRADTVAWTPSAHGVLHVSLPSGVRVLRFQPFGDDPLVAVAPDGSHWIVVERPAQVRHGAVAIRVARLAPTGDTLARACYRRRGTRLGRSAASDTARAIAAAVARTARTPPAAAERAVREALYVPDAYPPVTALVPGADGSVWLRREIPPGADVALWDVVDSDGAVVATVRAPVSLRVLRADGTRVWGALTDEMDVPSVVRYRLQKGAFRDGPVDPLTPVACPGG